MEEEVSPRDQLFAEIKRAASVSDQYVHEGTPNGEAYCFFNLICFLTCGCHWHIELMKERGESQCVSHNNTSHCKSSKREKMTNPCDGPFISSAQHTNNFFLVLWFYFLIGSFSLKILSFLGSFLNLTKWQCECFLIS